MTLKLLLKTRLICMKPLKSSIKPLKSSIQGKLVNMNVLRVNKYYLLVQGKQYKKLNLKGKEKEIITIKAHEDKPTEAI